MAVSRRFALYLAIGTMLVAFGWMVSSPEVPTWQSERGLCQFHTSMLKIADIIVSNTLFSLEVTYKA